MLAGGTVTKVCRALILASYDTGSSLTEEATNLNITFSMAIKKKHKIHIRIWIRQLDKCH